MNKQILLFLISIAIGLIGGFIYGIICIFRKHIKHNTVGVYIEDITFWLIYSIFTFLTMLYYNYGEIRPFIFMGVFLGLLVYALLIHRFVEKLSIPIIFVFKSLAKVIISPVMIFCYPFKIFLSYFKKYLKKK